MCIVVLAAAGICTWKFGPWSNDEKDTKTGDTYAALNTCDGCCNGLASNCALAVNEVLFPMVHNAHSSKADLFLAYNNRKSSEEALVAGFRGLMLDSCICDGSIGETLQNLWKEKDLGENSLGFCHSSCDAGVRNPAEVLGNIKTFLDVNKNEVLILEFEINDDSLVELYSAIDVSGLAKYVYQSQSTTIEWPTMQSLIDANSRLLIFAHGDGMESCDTMTCPEGVFYTYDHFEQTDWNDDTCDIIGNKKEGMGFFLMNHWRNSDDLDLPSESNAEEFNTFDALTNRFEQCKGRRPNVVAVDFWDVGDVLPFVKEVNLKNVE